MSVYLFSGMATAIPVTLFVFMVEHVVQEKDLMAYVLISHFLMAAVGVPFWLRMVRAKGHAIAWLSAMLLSLSAFLFSYMIQPSDWLLFLTISIVTGFAAGADVSVPVSLVAEFGKSRQSSGFYLGIWNMLVKCSYAAGAGIGLVLLGILDFNPNEPDSIAPLLNIYVIVPTALKLIACALLFLYRNQLKTAD